MRRTLSALLAALVLVSGLWGRVWAAHLPEPDRACSVTIELQFDETPLQGGSLKLYRVGRIGPDGSSFVPVEALAADCPAFQDLQSPELAKALYALARSHALEPVTAPIGGGRAVFTGLETGVYVIAQPGGEETPGFAAIDPFLMSAPQWRGDGYVYDLTASPKVPLVPAPTEPTSPTTPTEPGTPELPQTGQLNWPIPLMAAMGLGFFCLGWYLIFGEKEKRV